MIFLPLVLLPAFGWLVRGVPWYAAAGAGLAYAVWSLRWARYLRRSAAGAG